MLAVYRSVGITVHARGFPSSRPVPAGRVRVGLDFHGSGRVRRGLSRIRVYTRSYQYRRLVFHSFIHSFIHSCILAISIEPLQVLYCSEALPTTARILYRSFTPKRWFWGHIITATCSSDTGQFVVMYCNVM